jgi:hypothetical protein
MFVVRIQHPVPDYGRWKAAFDSDPVGRERSGMRRYRVMRAVDDPNDVLIDLDFDTSNGAEAFLAAMRSLWGRVEGTIMSNPVGRIVETVETHEY